MHYCAFKLLRTSIAIIKTKLSDIEDLDSGILETYESHDVFTLDADVFTSEVDSQAAYVYKVNEILAELNTKFNYFTTGPSGGQGPGLPGGGASNLGQFTAPKLQQIHITPFSGDKDVLEFSDLLKSFNDLVGDRSNLTKSAKLIYLKSFLSGGALDCVKHLSNEDDNFDIAISFLKKEFLDKDLVVDRHMKRLMNLKAPNYSDVGSLRSFLTEARTSIYELRNFGYDCTSGDTLGSKIVSFLLYEKLSRNFKYKMSFLTGTDYLTVELILQHYPEVIKSLTKTQAKKDDKTEKPLSKQKKGNNSSKTETNGTGNSALQTFHTRADSFDEKSSGAKQKTCKLCNGEHSMLRCTEYNSPILRVTRLDQLKLCRHCSGKHDSDKCRGIKGELSFKCNNCGTHEHITAVCSQVSDKQNRICIFNNYKTDNEVAGPVLLPSIFAIMHSDRDEVVLARCIVDPGSQSSYISSHLKSKLGLDNMATIKFNLKTFLGSGVRKYETVMCNILLPSVKSKPSF